MKNNTARWAVAVLLLVLLVFPIAAAAAQSGSTTTLYLPVVSKVLPKPVIQVGPEGGTFPGVAVNPANANIIYAGSYGAGMYKSEDAGLTWRAINKGLTNLFIQTVSVTPDGGTAYAGTYGSGIFRSNDGGTNWQATNNGFPNSATGFIVYDIEISPATPTTLYASIREKGTFETTGKLVSYVLQSTDGGNGWTQIWSGWMANSGRGDYSYDVDLRSSDGSLFLATHENGVYRLPPGATTWLKLQNDNDPNYFNGENLSSRNVDVINNTVLNSIYKVAGVYKSTNGGTTWSVKTNGLPAIYGFALERDPANPAVYFLSTANNGVYKSTDTGESWSSKGLAGTYVWRFGFSPSNTQQIYAGTSGNGVQYSPDGGATWQWRGAGIYNATVSGLAVLPSQPGTIYAATNGAGVYRSSDKGVTWERVINGLGDLNVKALLVIYDKLYAVTATNLYTSADGVNWSAAVTMAPTPLSAPQEQGSPAEATRPAFSQLDLQPEEEMLLRAEPAVQEAVDGPLVALGFGKPITAAAQNWKGLWVGTAGAGIWLSDKTCSANTEYNQIVYALYNHKGELWASIDKYDTTNMIMKYYVMKFTPQSENPCNWDTNMDGIDNTKIKVNSFASGPNRLLAATSAGVYAYSTATNPNWLPASGLTGAVYAIATDPANPYLVYAAAESGAYISADGGIHWLQVNRGELQNRAFVSVLVDPQSSNLVYFGSRDGSTYRWDKTAQ